MKRATGLVLIALLATASSGAPSPSPAEQQLIDLEATWMTAIVERNDAVLRQLYAEEYLYTGPDGSVADKATDITEIVSGTTELKSSRRTNMKVSFYGAVALVTGVNAIKGTRNEKNIGGRYRFTDAFVKRDGRWQVVAAHETRVSR